ASGDKAVALADLATIERALPGNPQVAALRAKIASEMQAQAAGTPAAPAPTTAPATRPADPTDEANAARERILALYNKGAFKEALQAATDNEAKDRARFGPESLFEAFAL